MRPRYGLDYNRTLLAQAGDEFSGRGERRRWWDYTIVAVACGVFLWLGTKAVVPPLEMDMRWVAGLGVVLAVSLRGWELDAGEENSIFVTSYGFGGGNCFLPVVSL